MYEKTCHLTQAFPNDFQHGMFGLEAHHGAVNGTWLLKEDKIGTIFLRRMLFETDNVRVHVGAAKFVQDGNA